jgi:hypothetical protein
MDERQRVCSECHDIGPWLLRRTDNGRLTATCGACIADLAEWGITVDAELTGSLFAYTNAPKSYDIDGVVIGSNDLGIVSGHPCRSWNGRWRLVETDDAESLVRMQLDRYNSGIYGAMRSRLFEEEVAPYLEGDTCNDGMSTTTVSQPS